MPQGTGAVPFATLVQTGFDSDGTPLLLLSKLAIHRRNIERSPQASLLFDGTAGMADRLAGPRITVAGRIEHRDDPAALQRFVAQNPGAELYAGFSDFALFALIPDAAHFVSGFGAIRWVPVDRLLIDAAAAQQIARQAPQLIEQANLEHGGGLAAAAGQEGAAQTRIAALDAAGIDVTVTSPGGSVSRYLPFGKIAASAVEARRALARLLERSS